MGITRDLGMEIEGRAQLGSGLNLNPPPEMTDANMVSFIDFVDSANFHYDSTSKMSVLLDKYQNKALGAEKLNGAWSITTGWVNNGGGQFT
ncbi:MAG: hypothetical protein WCR72_14705, partial [Bacteroidota bacterium]